jgi:hypothetical protein
MIRTKKKKRRKPLRYKTVTLKLTARQKKSLDNFCKSRRSTPIKVIKKSIRPLLENYVNASPQNQYISVNQLELFNLD